MAIQPAKQSKAKFWVIEIVDMLQACLYWIRDGESNKEIQESSVIKDK